MEVVEFCRDRAEAMGRHDEALTWTVGWKLVELTAWDDVDVLVREDRSWVGDWARQGVAEGARGFVY